MTGWTKKFGGLFRPTPSDGGSGSKRKIEISEPLRQVGGTSVDHVQSLVQISDHLLEIEKSAKYMKKLIEKNQKELIPQVVTLIIDTVQKMLDDIVVIVGRYPEICKNDQWTDFFESRQQEARNYLAALVKLSDSSSEISHDDTQMTQEMVLKLQKVLRNIIDYARFRFPETLQPVSLFSRSYFYFLSRCRLQLASENRSTLLLKILNISAAGKYHVLEAWGVVISEDLFVQYQERQKSL